MKARSRAGEVLGGKFTEAGEKEYPLHKENYRQVILTGGNKGEISSFNQKWSRRSREAARTCLLKAPKGKRGSKSTPPKGSPQKLYQKMKPSRDAEKISSTRQAAG